MKVLMITATYPPMSSGGADYAFRLSQQLCDQGLSVHVLTNEKAVLPDKSNIEMYPIMDSWSWRELPRFCRIIAQVKPDVINLHFGGILYNNQPMIGFAATIAKWILPSVRFVTLIEASIGLRVYLCSLPVRALHKIMIALTKCFNVNYSYGTLLRDSDAIIVLSNLHKLDLARYDKSIASKTYLLPVPPLLKFSDISASPQQGRSRLNIGLDQPVICYLGYIYPGKGLETLLAAFKIVHETKKNACLVIIGGTPQIVLADMRRPQYKQELLSLALELGISQNVIWTGAYDTDSEEPSLYLRASNLAVLPFDQGVFLSNSSFAACAAHHLPIVTTKGASLETPFVDKENLILVPPMNPQCLAQTILATLADVRLLEKISDGAYRLSQKITWAKTTEQTIAIFRGEKPTDPI